MTINPLVRYGAANVNNTDPTGYPAAAIKNSTSNTAQDGTPNDEGYLNDSVGFQQAALTQAGMTVSNVAEKVSASQTLQAISKHVSGAASFIDSGAADVYVLDPIAIVSTFFETPKIPFRGMRAHFFAANTSTGASTIDFSAFFPSLSAKAIVLQDGTPLVAGSINTTDENEVVYDLGNDRWVLVKGAAAAAGGEITRGTKQSPTSGTSVNFAIPAATDRFYFSWDKVGFTAITNPATFKFGVSGGIQSTAYSAAGVKQDGASVESHSTTTTSFVLTNVDANTFFSGYIECILIDPANNVWSVNGSVGIGGKVWKISGQVTLTGEITQVEFAGGTFHASSGSMNTLFG